MTIDREVKILKPLAERVGEAAHSTINRERKQLWLDSNGLRMPERPPVFLELYDTWAEILPESSLLCEDPLAREIEYKLRKILYKYDLGDDDVIEPWMEIDAVTNLGRNRGVDLWGLYLGRRESQERGWLYSYHPLKEMEDLVKLSSPHLQYDRTATEERRCKGEELLAGAMPVKASLGNMYRQWAKLHSWAAAFCGMENLFIFMIEKPDFIHALMRFFQRGILSLMDQAEEAGILHLNNIGRLSCNDLPSKDFNETRINFKDIWGRGESQEIDGVSPAMFEEFLFQYQEPILSRFGIVNYGCCENLTNKIPIVLKLHNLRQFICSAWTSPEDVARFVDKRCAIEWRQKATDVITAQDKNQLRKPLEEGLRILKGCYVQIMLDSVMTTNGNPGRLKEWVEVAKEVGSRFS